MIIYLEGLPRAGKSYSAMVDRIIPALKDGRAVWAYLEGMDRSRIAEASGVPLERVRALLHDITPDDIPNVHAVVANNSLVVIDEAQDWFPNRAKLGPELTKFVTQHGHRGIDVVLMGQDLRDVHVLWRRRVEIKQVFLKLSSVGKESSFSVNTYRKSANSDDFTHLSFATGKYEEKYFGTYASHVAPDVQKANYQEKAATIWGNSVFTRWLPLAVVGGLFGVWYVWRMFSGSAPLVRAPAPASAPPVVAAPTPVAVPPRLTAQLPLPVAPLPAARASDPVELRLSSLTSTAQIRYAGGMSRADGSVDGLVEWWDAGSSRVLERLTIRQLQGLGVAVEVINASSVRLTYGSWATWATMWPIESASRVSVDRVQATKGSV